MPKILMDGQPPIFGDDPLLRWGSILLVLSLAALSLLLLFFSAPYPAIALMGPLLLTGGAVTAGALGRPGLIPASLIYLAFGVAHLVLAWGWMPELLLIAFPFLLIAALVSRPREVAPYLVLVTGGGAVLFAQLSNMLQIWVFPVAMGALWGGLLVMIYTVNRLRRAALQYSITDPLTGAYNRRYLEGFVKDHDRRGRAAMLLLDMDHFKALNDEKGHAAGDRALRRLVRLVQANWASDAVCFRLGGDEFVLMLKLSARAQSEMSNHEQDRHLGRLARSILKGLNDDGSFSVSGGLAHFGWPCDFEDVYRRADFALYQAKDQGRGRMAESDSLPSLSQICAQPCDPQPAKPH